MAPPDAEEIQVAISALRQDAKKWEASWQGMLKIEAELLGLGLGLHHFGYIAEHTGLIQAYDELHMKILEFIRQGYANFFDVKTALNKVANNYEAEEKRNIHRSRKSW